MSIQVSKEKAEELGYNQSKHVNTKAIAEQLDNVTKKGSHRPDALFRNIADYESSAEVVNSLKTMRVFDKKESK